MGGEHIAHVGVVVRGEFGEDLRRLRGLSPGGAQQQGVQQTVASAEVVADRRMVGGTGVFCDGAVGDRVDAVDGKECLGGVQQCGAGTFAAGARGSPRLHAGDGTGAASRCILSQVA